MIRAAAVLMYLPFPSGFLGTGVIGKLSSVRRGAAATTTIVFGLVEEKAVVREGIFLGPWVELIRGDEIPEMTPLFRSRLIQQPSRSFSADHPSRPLTATLWLTGGPSRPSNHQRNRWHLTNVWMNFRRFVVSTLLYPR